MRPFSLLKSLTLLPLAHRAHGERDCSYYQQSTHNRTCEEPIDSVTTISDGSFYVAKVPCLNCPILKWTGRAENRRYSIIHADNDLFYNLTLSHEKTSLLLNGKPIFPKLEPASSGQPPSIYVSQVSPSFTRAELDAAVACTREPCHDYICWCLKTSFSSVAVDYDYSAHLLPSHDSSLRWKITFDAIGGQDGFMGDPVWVFNDTRQSMLQVEIRGKEIEQEEVVPDIQAGSTLFGPSGEEQEIRYELEIVDVRLVERSYTFPPAPVPTFWSKVKHFFGSDPPPPPYHTIALQEEWSGYGKKDTLKDTIGIFIHDWPWDLVLIIVASIIGGLMVLYGVYRVFLVILEQRRLAQWGGMDEVWRQIREGGTEEDGLLDERYRDDPDDEPPPRYSAELPVNKPLPSIPLPDKPLPAVPLIDDI